MYSIIFRKNFEVKKDFIDADLIKKFPYANEFYTAIKVDEGDFNEDFIQAVISRKNLKEEFFKLEAEERLLAEELFLSIVNLVPEFADKEIIKLLDEEIKEDLSKLKTQRKEALEKSRYLYLCKPERYFYGIADGEMVSVEDNFFDNRKQEVIK